MSTLTETTGSQVHPDSALASQVGGDHYAKLAIQPVEYIHANKIPFMEGCAIKYLTRWRDKGGVKDLEKARHFIDLLIELETRKAPASSVVHSDAKNTSRCAESHYKAVCAEQGHRWTHNPENGSSFCGICLIDMPPPKK